MKYRITLALAVVLPVILVSSLACAESVSFYREDTAEQYSENLWNLERLIEEHELFTITHFNNRKKATRKALLKEIEALKKEQGLK